MPVLPDQPDLFQSGEQFEIPRWLRRYPDGNQIRIFANGYDVTDSMPRTKARLEKQRAEGK